MILTLGTKVWVDFQGKRRLGSVIRPNNQHTMWVRIMLGAQSRALIKRHIVKHNIVKSMVN